MLQLPPADHQLPGPGWQPLGSGGHWLEAVSEQNGLDWTGLLSSQRGGEPTSDTAPWLVVRPWHPQQRAEAGDTARHLLGGWLRCCLQLVPGAGPAPEMSCHPTGHLMPKD